MELLKKYSTYNEVIAYLKDRNGYEYDLYDLYQLEVEGKIEIYLYLTNPKIRLETNSTTDEGYPKYDFRYIPLEGIFKKIHGNSVFFKGGVFDDEVIVDPGMLKMHELFSEYYLDKLAFDPIPYDENHVFFSGLKHSQQDELKDSLRFDSEQIKSLCNIDIEQQSVIKHLTTENERLKSELAKLKGLIPIEEQGYLDPANKFFSIEMKLCHDTWNYLYKNGVKPRLAHTREVKKYLEDYPDFEVNSKAIKRIATITNPKAVLAKSDSDKEDLK